MANKIVTFAVGKDYNNVIIDILNKNGLKESWDDYFEKVQQNKAPWSDALYILTKKLALKNITDKEFISEIQKNLNTNDKIAEQILKDVKEKLIPLTLITTDEEEINQEPVSNIGAPALTPRQPPTKKTTKILYSPPKSAPESAEKSKKIPEKPITPNNPKRSGPDTYREPIE